MTACSSSKRKCVKYVFFDFDQTISRCHVFKQLAGWEDLDQCVPPPFACTERGQISRISELNSSKGWLYDEDKHVLVSCTSRSVSVSDTVTERAELRTSAALGGTTVAQFRTHSTRATAVSDIIVEGAESWTSATLGGGTRVARLRTFFADLRAKGVTLIVITKGFVGAVRKILEEEQLLEYITAVYGNIGGVYGKTGYDEALRVAFPFEGSEKYSLNRWAAKVNIIKSIMAENNLDPAEAVLVEDDPLEIEAVRSTCRSVFVSEQRGMMHDEMEEIIRMADASASVSELSTLSAPASASASTPSCAPETKGRKTQRTVVPGKSIRLVTKAFLKSRKQLGRT